MPAALEKIDDYTFRFVFEKPRLQFLANLGLCERQITGCPKHYLSQFHPRFASEETIERHMRVGQFHLWSQLYMAKVDLLQNSNAELPTLCPWIVEAGIPTNPARYVRNPYSWVVDSEGHQLPYVDEVLFTLVGNPERMKLRQVLGHLSYGRMSLDTLELAKLEADKGHIRIGLGPPNGDLNAYTLAFNFLAPDPFKARLFNDRRFRIAMSLQMPRQVINEVIDSGLTRPKQIGVSNPTHPWYNETLATAYLEYDLDEANRLLDAIGLLQRDAAGLRLDPEGEPITFNVMAIRHPRWVPAANIVAEYLTKVGLRANVRSIPGAGERDRMRQADWDLWLYQDIMDYPHYWPDRMEAVRPSIRHSYKWMRWMGSDGAFGIEPPDVMKQCYRRWKSATNSTTEPELTEHIQWRQTTAAKELWAVGINSFPPVLWFSAVNVQNVPLDQRVFFKTAVWVDKRVR